MTTFLEAYALHGCDTIAIADALGIPEHQADSLINAKMNRERLGPPALQSVAISKPKPRPKIRFAGFDPSEKELETYR